MIQAAGEDPEGWLGDGLDIIGGFGLAIAERTPMKKKAKITATKTTVVAAAAAAVTKKKVQAVVTMLKDNNNNR